MEKFTSIYIQKIKNTKNILSIKKKRFDYYATLLPIISQDIAQMISNYFVEIGTAEEVFSYFTEKFFGT